MKHFMVSTNVFRLFVIIFVGLRVVFLPEFEWSYGNWKEKIQAFLFISCFIFSFGLFRCVSNFSIAILRFIIFFHLESEVEESDLLKKNLSKQTIPVGCSRKKIWLNNKWSYIWVRVGVCYESTSSFPTNEAFHSDIERVSNYTVSTWHCGGFVFLSSSVCICLFIYVLVAVFASFACCCVVFFPLIFFAM